MAIGNRKNNCGKRQRKNGPIWVQTCVKVDINYENQKRKVINIKAMVTENRKKDTIPNNLIQMINTKSNIQSDSFSSYYGLNKIFNSITK